MSENNPNNIDDNNNNNDNNDSIPADTYRRLFANSTQNIRIANEIADLLKKEYPQVIEHNPIDLVNISQQLLVYSILNFLREEGPFSNIVKLNFIKHFLKNVAGVLYTDCENLELKRNNKNDNEENENPELEQ